MSKKDACYHKVKARYKVSRARMLPEVLQNAEKLVQKTGVTRHRKSQRRLSNQEEIF